MNYDENTLIDRIKDDFKITTIEIQNSKDMLEKYPQVFENGILNDIYFNKFNTIFEKLNTLGSLSIENFPIGRIFPAIFKMTNLIELKLININIENIPEDIVNLKNLKYLKLNNNKLQYLPNTIGKLKSLTRLILNNNKLQSLPDTIGNSKALLYELDVGNNMLQSLPDTIGNFRSIRVLNLSNNKLQSLPDTIGNFLIIGVLNLSNNNLQSLPDIIGKLQTLEELYFNNNNLQSLPDTIGNLKSLKELNLNNIINIPYSISLLYEETILKDVNDIQLIDAFNILNRRSIDSTNNIETSRAFDVHNRYNDLINYYYKYKYYQIVNEYKECIQNDIQLRIANIEENTKAKNILEILLDIVKYAYNNTKEMDIEDRKGLFTESEMDEIERSLNSFMEYVENSTLDSQYVINFIDFLKLTLSLFYIIVMCKDNENNMNIYKYNLLFFKKYIKEYIFQTLHAYSSDKPRINRYNINICGISCIAGLIERIYKVPIELFQEIITSYKRDMNNEDKLILQKTKVLFPIIEEETTKKGEKEILEISKELIVEYLRDYIQDKSKDEKYIKEFSKKSLLEKQFEIYKQIFEYIYKFREQLDIFDNFMYSDNPYITYYDIHKKTEEVMKEYKNFNNNDEWEEPIDLMYGGRRKRKQTKKIKKIIKKDRMIRKKKRNTLKNKDKKRKTIKRNNKDKKKKTIKRNNKKKQ